MDMGYFLELYGWSSRSRAKSIIIKYSIFYVVNNYFLFLFFLFSNFKRTFRPIHLLQKYWILLICSLIIFVHACPWATFCNNIYIYRWVQVHKIIKWLVKWYKLINFFIRQMSLNNWLNFFENLINQICIWVTSSNYMGNSRANNVIIKYCK